MKLITRKGIKIPIKRTTQPKLSFFDNKVKTIKIDNEFVDMYADVINGFNFYISVGNSWYLGNIFNIEKIKSLEECKLIYED